MSARLTDRDMAILVDVQKYRYLNVSQIEALHFPSLRTSYRRLQALIDRKYLKSFTIPNIAGRVYYLDKYGAGVVAEKNEVSLKDLGWNRTHHAPKDYYFLRHFLAVNDFRIALDLACQKSDISVLGFIPEYIGEKTNKGNIKKYLRDTVKEYSHTPDGVFALEKDGKTALFFLEVDRGTEVVNNPDKGFLKAIVFYLNYWSQKQFQRYEKDFGREFKTFRSLIVTPSTQRLANMREAVTGYEFPSKQAKRFLWGTTEVTKDNIFTSIWQTMDTGDNKTYTIG